MQDLRPYRNKNKTALSFHYKEDISFGSCNLKTYETFKKPMMINELHVRVASRRGVF